jgi:hypothetical protein
MAYTDETSPRIDTGAMLSRSFELPAGPRVRLRMAHRSDLFAIRALLEQRGVDATELELSRLVSYDPRERIVICAVAWLGGAETIVGVGASYLARGSEPETLVVDERLTEGLGTLLTMALADRRRASRRGRRAA